MKTFPDKYNVLILYTFLLEMGKNMKTLAKNVSLTLLISAFMVFILLHAPKAKEFAALGLQTWFGQLIPSLLPFMILSGLLIRMNLIPLFCKPFGLLLRPLFRMSDSCIYVFVMGFLCGFPMGAKNTADLYSRKQLTRDEAEFLLAFTNNIGPVYFLSFVTGKVYHTDTPFFCILCQFLLPVLYGLVLRYTWYRSKLPVPVPSVSLSPRMALNGRADKNHLVSLFDALDESIMGGLVQIAALGGYMIFFNLLVLIPAAIFRHNPYQGFLHSLLELSGGLELLGRSALTEKTKLLLAHTALSFNGMCCMFQTLHLIHKTDLSIQKYMFHKLILCVITILFLLACPLSP